MTSGFDSGGDWVEVDGLMCTMETEKAVLLGDPAEGKEAAQWYPKSQMRYWPGKEQVGPVKMKEWLARKSGLV